jgi:sialic acid synthase SpsE
MILQSKMGGANAVKVQLYDTYRMPGKDRQRWEYLSMSRNVFQRLENYANALNIDFFASAFDADRIQWMLYQGIKINKVASSILSENSLVREEIFDSNINKFDKTFVSLGQWDQADLPVPSGPLRRYSDRIIYFHCLPKYPHDKHEAIRNLPSRFEDSVLGYSDHSIGIDACIEAATRGAKYIEKHFTTDHNLQSQTESAHTCSMNYQELVTLRNEVDKL